MKKFHLIIAAVAVTLFASSCKKDKNNDDDSSSTATTGTVTVNMSHRWVSSSSNFLLNMQLIHPMTGDTLVFTTLKYYVSNLKLKKEDGTWISMPESYFLVDLTDDNSAILSFPNVPVGEYTDLEYTMGVDSTRNVSGAQTGALALTNDMFWSWNSGYIMLKAEGTSPNSSTGSYSFHLGGFSGTNNIVTTNTVNFTGYGDNLTVTANHTSEVHMLVNVAKLWHNAPSVDSINTIHMPGQNAVNMASAFYTQGITFDHLHE